MSTVIKACSLDDGRYADHGLAAHGPEEDPHYVGGQGAVGVAVVLKVHHHQQLRKQDHVDQIRRQVPEGEGKWRHGNKM